MIPGLPVTRTAKKAKAVVRELAVGKHWVSLFDARGRTEVDVTRTYWPDSDVVQWDLNSPPEEEESVKERVDQAIQEVGFHLFPLGDES